MVYVHTLSRHWYYINQWCYTLCLVKRKDVGKYATKGGFVDMDEPTEEAVVRELKEEMNAYWFIKGFVGFCFVWFCRVVQWGMLGNILYRQFMQIITSEKVRDICSYIFQFSHTPEQTGKKWQILLWWDERHQIHSTVVGDKLFASVEDSVYASLPECYYH